MPLTSCKFLFVPFPVWIRLVLMLLACLLLSLGCLLLLPSGFMSLSQLLFLFMFQYYSTFLSSRPNVSTFSPTSCPPSPQNLLHILPAFFPPSLHLHFQLSPLFNLLRPVPSFPRPFRSTLPSTWRAIRSFLDRYRRGQLLDWRPMSVRRGKRIKARSH